MAATATPAEIVREHAEYERLNRERPFFGFTGPNGFLPSLVSGRCRCKACSDNRELCPSCGKNPKWEGGPCMKCTMSQRADKRAEIQAAVAPSEWKEGRLAYLAGELKSANPYRDYSACERLWDDGWDFEDNEKTELDELASVSCFICGDPALPETRGFDPRCEVHAR